MSGYYQSRTTYGHGSGGLPLTKTVTFSNTSGAVNLFTVTGDVDVRVRAVCTTNVESAAAGNIEVGISGSTDSLIATTLSTNLEAREVWWDASPDSEVEAASTDRFHFVTDGNDIILTCSAQIDSGVIAFYLWWNPCSSGSSVVVA